MIYKSTQINSIQICQQSKYISNSPTNILLFGWPKIGLSFGFLCFILTFIFYLFSNRSNIIKLIIASMHFSKFMTVSQIQNNTQLINQQLSKSPQTTQESRNNQNEDNQPYHIRNNTNFHPQIHTLSTFQNQPHHFRPTSPVYTSPLEKYQIKNPQNYKSAHTLPNRQQSAKYNFLNLRNRKNSQNNIIYEQQQQHMKNSVLAFHNPLPKQQPSPFKKNCKQRKSSCNLDTSVMFKMGTKKSSQNEDSPHLKKVKEQRGAKLMKMKSLGWDEDNNFQLCSNKSSDEQSQDLSRSQIDSLPIIKNINIRKHSDNDVVKKVPSFLTSMKFHRNSFDNVETLPKPSLSINNFKIIRQLGKGAFGRVVMAVQKQSKLICAIKIMAKRQIRQDNMLEQLVRQIKLQIYINHPNIIKIYGFFDDLLHFYIIMECALDGHLSDYLHKIPDPLSQNQAGGLFNQICSAVTQLHSESIIHRDLKPENVMLHEGIVKICDFGWSVYRGGQLRTTFCGTPIYLCPQILIGDEYDQSIDIWALGVILYQMLYKNNPFRITCKEQLVNILNQPIHYDETIKITEAAKDLIRTCLSKRAAQRPNIREIMLHQFLMRVQTNQQQQLRR